MRTTRPVGALGPVRGVEVRLGLAQRAERAAGGPVLAAGDGYSAARIEEEVVVTSDGREVITKFPAEELLIAGQRYWTAGGELPNVREAQSHLNTAVFAERQHAATAGTSSA